MAAPLLALDGCPLAGARASLALRGLTPLAQVRLDGYGVKKHKGRLFDQEEAAGIFPEVLAALGLNPGGCQA